MPSTADLKRRIGSVKNTQKITRAMKLVSAAKFNRAVQAVSAARPYKEAFQVMVSRLVADKAEKIKSPFFRKVEEEKKILLIALSTDRGLCGGLNANLMKKAQSFIETKKAENIQVDLAVWGRKAQQFFKSRHDGEYFSKELAVFNKPSYENVKTLMASVIEAFKDEVYDGVYLCLPKFESAIAQVPTVEQLLPTGSISQSEDLEPKGEEKKSEQASKDQHTADFKVEPSFEELIQDLLERGVLGQVFSSLLEGQASEHGARMSAMDSATNNADDVIKKLTLKYNRVRQAGITSELIEIISGAQAI